MSKIYYVKKYDNHGMIKYPFEDVVKDLLGDTSNSTSNSTDLSNVSCCDCCSNSLYNIGYKDNKIVLELNLCGYKKENISLTKNGNVLIVKAKAENSDVSYTVKGFELNDIEQRFVLPEQFINGDIQSKLQNGLLTILITSNEQVDNIEIKDEFDESENESDESENENSDNLE